MDALAIARANPAKEVVFFGIGFETTAPPNAMAVWLAGPDTADITGQVFAVGGGKAQLLGGWRPLTEVQADDVWSLDSLNAARDALTSGRPTSVPPFMPPVE